ncbi:hypothetical protein [Xylanibacter muris]|uniref:hypothetical protein n=1 Tax=Xylanibacter muris TaxID=2736290 RepID=UPI0015551CBA|nr:hypothetical protein [Xylanibacter muris]
MLVFILLDAVSVSAQSAQPTDYYLYNIITLDCNLKQERITVTVDDGVSIEKLHDSSGDIVVFKTPAAALMFIMYNGWELYKEFSSVGGAGNSYSGTGSVDIDTVYHWIIRKPCTKDDFVNAVANGIKGVK